MKAALSVNSISDNFKENLDKIIEAVKKAANQRADIVIFPETAITGLCLSDDPSYDIYLGLSKDSFEIKRLMECAKYNKISIAIGLLERDKNKLYDSAILIDRSGEIAFKYRRVSSGWRDISQNTIYKEGTEINAYNTDFGKVCFLICGDLFDEGLVNKVKDLKVDYVIFPFARCFISCTDIERAWHEEVFEEYLEQMRKLNANVLAVNVLDGEYFGGAFGVSAAGEVTGYLDVLKEEILYVEF